MSNEAGLWENYANFGEERDGTLSLEVLEKTIFNCVRIPGLGIICGKCLTRFKILKLRGRKRWKIEPGNIGENDLQLRDDPKIGNYPWEVFNKVQDSQIKVVVKTCLYRRIKVTEASYRYMLRHADLALQH
ncbi:hypothetical protein U1Q18_017176 [Sarracenia purpurea var. burkii]